jgi:hypothetical protein
LRVSWGAARTTVRRYLEAGGLAAARGILLGLAISAALWAVIGAAVWAILA